MVVQEFFFACISNATCFDPSHGPSSGNKKYLSKAQACVDAEFYHLASSQILQACFQFCDVLSG